MVTQEWAKDTVSHYHLLIIIYRQSCCYWRICYIGRCYWRLLEDVLRQLGCEQIGGWLQRYIQNIKAPEHWQVVRFIRIEHGKQWRTENTHSWIWKEDEKL
jgi:hypothetical protein